MPRGVGGTGAAFSIFQHWDRAGKLFQSYQNLLPSHGEEDMAVAALCSTCVLVKFKTRAFSHREKAGSSSPPILC